MENIEGSKNIICPWCDCEQKIKIMFQDGAGLILECKKCNGEFFVEAHMELRFYCSHIVDVEFKEDNEDNTKKAGELL